VPRQAHDVRRIQTHLIGLLQEDAQRLRQSLGGRSAEQGDGDCAAKQQDEGRDFWTLDDVAVLTRFIEPFLCRILCLL